MFLLCNYGIGPAYLTAKGEKGIGDWYVDEEKQGHNTSMTMNTRRGQILKEVILHPPRSVFSHEQLYVALSGVTQGTCLKISRL